ncbi:transglutaminase-like domain-containing protein [Erythrobacter rubeus]|uniref:Transglutaminase family protein n=1 Tax=Erythrobacter rubeus TaxID=2760803 RepID=A0ABR8KPV6_9SPHN|nr:transglutaminase family protein [Erythrobacter rubeus]MBD2842747.1 transglutaminase family protein [Erythrobacter rubeus]
MAIQIKTSFAFETEQPTDALLQFEAAALPEQGIVSASTELSDAEHLARVAAQDDIGERIWIRSKGRFEVSYEAVVEPRRIATDLAPLSALDPHDLPGEAVQYLLDSRYCHADRFQNFVSSEFGESSGGERIDAISQWLQQHFSYSPGASNPSTTAIDSMIAREGICRDYAHVLITLARASTIPARYVACYAPGVTPPDFHAVAEVFLADPSRDDGGAWQIIDATGMADPAKTAKIGVGRDAADVSFLTTFGRNQFLYSNVEVTEHED